MIKRTEQPTARPEQGCRACVLAEKMSRGVKRPQGVPDDVCLSLYLSCVPYITTLATGGWFKWSADTDRVDTQCPEGVQVDVLRKTLRDGTVTIEAIVNRTKAYCFKGYRKGQRINLFKVAASGDTLQLDSLLSETVAWLRDNQREREEGGGSHQQNHEVVVSQYDSSCWYFRRRGGRFAVDDLVPEGICADAFYQIYPHFLALLYDGESSPGRRGNRIKARCAHGELEWELSTRPYWFSALLKFGEWLARRVQIPYDFVDKKVFVRSVRKGCTGRKVEAILDHMAVPFTSGVFCPAAFFQMYPLLKAFGPNIGVPVCPSVQSNVTFEGTSKHQLTEQG